MHYAIPEDIKALFRPETNVGAVTLEAARILNRCTFDEVRVKFPEITFEGEGPDFQFDRRLDATLWDLRLGELLAEALQPQFEEEQAELKKAAEAAEKAGKK